MQIMPSVVSMPPNRSTASFDPAPCERSSATARFAASGTVLPADRPVVASTIASYQRSICSTPTSSSPSATTMVRAASGPASSRRSSPRPAGCSPAIRRSTSSSTTAVNRSRTASSRNGRAYGARSRECSSPSVVSMLRPTTWPVLKRGSSTVNASESRITASARSRRVTSQQFSAGNHATGSVSRRRARSGCGSASSSSTEVKRAAPAGRPRRGSRCRASRPWPASSRAPRRARDSRSSSIPSS